MRDTTLFRSNRVTHIDETHDHQDVIVHRDCESFEKNYFPNASDPVFASLNLNPLIEPDSSNTTI